VQIKRRTKIIVENRVKMEKFVSEYPIIHWRIRFADRNNTTMNKNPKAYRRF